MWPNLEKNNVTIGTYNGGSRQMTGPEHGIYYLEIVTPDAEAALVESSKGSGKFHDMK